MPRNCSYHREVTKNGLTKSYGANYETGKGLSTYSSSSSANVQNSKVQKPSNNPVGIVVGLVGIVVASTSVLNKVTGAKAANEVKDLDNSIRNSGNNPTK